MTHFIVIFALLQWFGARTTISPCMPIHTYMPILYKESACKCRRHGFSPWVNKIPWRKTCQPTPIFLPGKSHGQRRLVGYSPWGRKEWDMTEHSAVTHLLSTRAWIQTQACLALKFMFFTTILLCLLRVSEILFHRKTYLTSAPLLP